MGPPFAPSRGAPTASTATAAERGSADGGILRTFRGTLRPRDAHSGPRGAGCRLPQVQERPRIPAGAEAPPENLHWKAHPALFRIEAHRTPQGRKDIPQERGPRTYRSAQDKQRHRPGPARKEDGQGAPHRRNRGRTARRSHRHRGRARRPALRNLHGHRGYGAPGPKRLQDETPGGHGN